MLSDIIVGDINEAHVSASHLGPTLHISGQLDEEETAPNGPYNVRTSLARLTEILAVTLINLYIKCEPAERRSLNRALFRPLHHRQRRQRHLRPCRRQPASTFRLTSLQKQHRHAVTPSRRHAVRRAVSLCSSLVDLGGFDSQTPLHTLLRSARSLQRSGPTQGGSHQFSFHQQERSLTGPFFCGSDGRLVETCPAVGSDRFDAPVDSHPRTQGRPRGAAPT